MCRSRREVSNAYLVAIIGFDTEENEPCKVCPLSVYISPRFLLSKSNTWSLLLASNACALRNVRVHRRLFNKGAALLTRDAFSEHFPPPIREKI